MLFKNYSADKVFHDAGDFLVDLEPGGTVEIPDAYALPRFSGGTRIPALIEQLCPQLAPADSDTHEMWKTGTLAVKVIPVPAQDDVKALVDSGVPEGVAEQMAVFEKAKKHDKKAR